MTDKRITMITQYDMDYMGSVFDFDGRILRLINVEREEYVRDLFDKGVVEKLIRMNYIPNTWICSDHYIQELSDRLIIEHERLDYYTCADEWTPSMFIDAARFVSDFNLFLLQNYELELRDPHYENIVFRGCKPILLDFGSICPQEMISFEAYKRYWVYPIRIMSNKRISYDMSKALAVCLDNGISTSDVIRFRYGKTMESMYALMMKIHFAFCHNDVVVNPVYRWFFVLVNRIIHYDEKKRIRWKIRKYKKLSKQKYRKNDVYGRWTHYHDEFSDDEDLKLDKRFGYYLDVLSEVRKKDSIQSVLEIAGNSGAMARLVQSSDALRNICVSDYDVGAIEIGYNLIKDDARFYNNIVFSCVNILKPPGNFQNKKYDVVFALAITHHLILTQKLKISALFEIFDKYAKKYLVVEFMPLGLWGGDDNQVIDVPDWYNLEWFKNEMESHFKIIRVEKIEKNRVCLVGKKRNMDNTD